MGKFWLRFAEAGKSCERTTFGKSLPKLGEWVESGSKGFSCSDHWYHWLENSLLCSLGKILFKMNGEVTVPWGTGSWRQDDRPAGNNRGEHFIGILFDWQAGSSDEQTPQHWTPGMWILRFSEAGDKFVAAFAPDQRRSAAGLSEEILESPKFIRCQSAPEK